ncbi:hypothetical protein ACFQ61_08165 [Streptomyces sp. NPDC056500]|uniref:hypothetical protein n=1 Tax=Streptomyces sp. NPDC056500 TaxID=3345840 RepID=UPI0036B4FA1D
MSAQPAGVPSLELPQIVSALRTLGWGRLNQDGEPLTRTEALGLLLFAVDAELAVASVDPLGLADMQQGYAWGVAGAVSATTDVCTPEQRKRALHWVWTSLALYRVRLASVDARMVLDESASSAQGSEPGLAASALTSALLELMGLAIPDSDNPHPPGSGARVQGALKAAKPFIRQAHQSVENGLRRYRQPGS